MYATFTNLASRKPYRSLKSSMTRPPTGRFTSEVPESRTTQASEDHHILPSSGYQIAYEIERQNNCNHLPNYLGQKMFMSRTVLASNTLQKVGQLMLASPSAAALYKRVKQRTATQEQKSLLPTTDNQTITSIPDEVFEDCRMMIRIPCIDDKARNEYHSTKVSARYNKRLGMFQSINKQREAPKHTRNVSSSLSNVDKKAIRDLVKQFYKNSGKVITGESLVSAINQQKSIIASNSFQASQEKLANPAANTSLLKEESSKLSQMIYQIQGSRSKSKEEIPSIGYLKPPYEPYHRCEDLRLREPRLANLSNSGPRLVRRLKKSVAEPSQENPPSLIVKGTQETKSASNKNIMVSRTNIGSYPKNDVVQDVNTKIPKQSLRLRTGPQGSDADLKNATNKKEGSQESGVYQKRDRKIFSLNTKY
jgi:hypothetical protein